MGDNIYVRNTTLNAHQTALLGFLKDFVKSRKAKSTALFSSYYYDPLELRTDFPFLTNDLMNQKLNFSKDFYLSPTDTIC